MNAISLQAADLLVTAASITTLDANDAVFAPGAIAVQGERIAAVGPADVVAARYSAAKRIDAPECHLFPGLINTHTHLYQTLLKGLGDDMPLIAWLQALTMPTIPHLDGETCYVAAAL